MSGTALGWYVYCVVPTAPGVTLEGMAGVDPRFEVQSSTEGPLSAVVSRVGLEEFGADALRQNLEDLPWLERTARAHDAVLARALDGSDVVPLRLCTIFTDEERVRDMLRRRRQVLLDDLAHLQGHVEWSVKVMADPERVESAVRRLEPASAGGETGSRGRAYLERKRQERDLRETVRDRVEGAADGAHAQLAAKAREAKLLPLQNPRLSGRRGHMVLNAAYLVDRRRDRELGGLAHRLDEELHHQGMELALTGPWAPYNFVTGRGEAG